MKLRYARDAIRYARWRITRPLALPQPLRERNVGAEFPLPNELVDLVMVQLDIRTLISLGASSAGMRALVRRTFAAAVYSSLKPFIPDSKMQSFFDCLTEVEGVIFGDVALRVQVRARWRLWGMHIAIPHGHAVALVGWLMNCGYTRRPVSRPHSWGTTHIYGLQNLQVRV